MDESFGEAGLLDWPQYTRPAEFRGWKVPDVLMSGHHENIRRLLAGTESKIKLGKESAMSTGQHGHNGGPSL